MGETPTNAKDESSADEADSAEATLPVAAGGDAATGLRRLVIGRHALLLRPEAGLPLITLALCVYLSFSSEYFLQWQNLLNVTFAVSAIGIAASFATLVVIGGGLDLTPVTVGIMAGLTCVKGLDAGFPVLVVIAIALAAASGIGLLNGLLVGVGRLNPFIVTLGTNFLFTGIAFVVTSGGALNVENADFAKIGQSLLWFDIPTPTVIMVAAFAAAWFLLRYTRFGTHVMAIGGDESAARLGGVRVVRVKIILYTISALAAGIAGVVAASAAGSVAAYAASGSNDLLAIIAAVIIGGTALTGGHGSVVGTLVGVLLIGLIGNGLVLDNISSFYQPVVTGSILLIAIILDEVRRRSMAPV
jgi:ribose transport system permease protein